MSIPEITHRQKFFIGDKVQFTRTSFKGQPGIIVGAELGYTDDSDGMVVKYTVIANTSRTWLAGFVDDDLAPFDPKVSKGAKS